MVKILARDVLPQLKLAGFTEIRIVGDHHRFTDGHGHYVTVPYSRTKEVIKPGTWSAIKKQAGWS